MQTRSRTLCPKIIADIERRCLRQVHSHRMRAFVTSKAADYTLIEGGHIQRLSTIAIAASTHSYIRGVACTNQPSHAPTCRLPEIAWAEHSGRFRTTLVRTKRHSMTKREGYSGYASDEAAWTARQFREARPATGDSRWASHLCDWPSASTPRQSTRNQGESRTSDIKALIHEAA